MPSSSSHGTQKAGSFIQVVPMCRFNCRPSINSTCRSIKQRLPFFSKYHAIDKLIGTYLVNKFQKMMSHCSIGRTR
nr:hypothetical protein CFP56_18592 [Quercus suber]